MDSQKVYSKMVEYGWSFSEDSLEAFNEYVEITINELQRGFELLAVGQEYIPSVEDLGFAIDALRALIEGE